MAETQHTPGPWEFDESRCWLFRDDLKADGKFSSTTVFLIQDNAFRPGEANARLIAAAPDMLEALRWAAKVIRPGTDLRQAMDAAIAKAEGRS